MKGPEQLSVGEQRMGLVLFFGEVETQRGGASEDLDAPW